MKIALLAFCASAVLLTSCTTTSSTKKSWTRTTKNNKKHQLEAPHLAKFLSIYEETYVLHENDCSNKCAKYAKLLADNGYDVGVGVFRPAPTGYLHAVVGVRFSCGTVRWYCPTQNSSSLDPNFYGQLLYIIPYSDIEEGTTMKYGMPATEFIIVE
jgi:hypothetical protein